MTRIVTLVPRRAGKPDRDRDWAFSRDDWQTKFPEFEVFEGHHDDGLFNRSAAINRAAGLADWERDDRWDVAIIIDADILIDEKLVREGVRQAIETGRMVLPFNVRNSLSPWMTEKVLNGYTGDGTKRNPATGKSGIAHVYTEMVSGVVIVTRELWDAVHGFDEGFAGWGFEDNAFAAACETFGGEVIKMRGQLWHLFHETAKKESVGTATFEANRARADRYLAVRGDREATLALRRLSPPAFTHRPTGIPRIIHRVVPEFTTPEVEGYWTEMERLHPEWTMMTHRDPLPPEEWPETSAKWSECRNGAQLADLIRAEALWRWGGIYVDSDYEPFRAFDPLLPLSAFAAWEDVRTIPNAVMGAVPGHPAIREVLDLMLARIPGETWQAGPGVTTAVLPNRTDVLVLPPGTFYPVHYRDPDRAAKMAEPDRAPWSFGLHHYVHSWKGQE